MLDIFSIAVIAIRTVSLFILAEALSGIPGLITLGRSLSNHTTEMDSGSIAAIAGATMCLVIAALFLIFAPKLARFLTKGLENTTVKIDGANYLWLQTIAFATLGAYFLIISLPNLLTMIIFNLFSTPHSVTESFPFAGSYKIPVESIIQESARVVLGLVLILGLRGIASAIGSNWGKRGSEDNHEMP